MQIKCIYRDINPISKVVINLVYFTMIATRFILLSFNSFLYCSRTFVQLADLLENLDLDPIATTLLKLKLHKYHTLDSIYFEELN